MLAKREHGTLVRTFAAILLLVTIGSLSSAQEWSRFRGPNGAGESEATTIPTKWTEEDFLWKTELPGVGNSSPVLWGERIFLTSADAKTGARHVLCVSAGDGKLLWKRDYPSQTHEIHKFNTLASSTPAVDEQHVYCAWSTPEEFTLLALDHAGSPVWQANLGPFISQHGFGTSPVLFEELVIITNDEDADSFVVAVDRASGKTRWKVARKRLEQQNTCYSTPCFYANGGQTPEMIVCSRAHGVTSINPRTGETNWEVAALERRAVSSPIVVDGLIFATCGEGSGNNSVVAVRPPKPGAAAEVAYKLDKTTAPYVPCPVSKGDLVFLWSDRGIVSCIDAADGHVHWRQRVGGNYLGSPVRVGDCIYCIADDGQVVSVAASKEFKLLGKSPLGETGRSTPAVADGRMFLRSDTHLVAIGRK